MRRLLRDIAEGKALGDTTTLADTAVVARLKGQYGEEERSVRAGHGGSLTTRSVPGQGSCFRMPLPLAA